MDRLKKLNLPHLEITPVINNKSIAQCTVRAKNARQLTCRARSITQYLANSQTFRQMGSQHITCHDVMAKLFDQQKEINDSVSKIDKLNVLLEKCESDLDRLWCLADEARKAVQQ